MIGGCVLGAHGLDSIVVGYYKDNDLIHVAGVRNGFVPASRRQLFGKLQPLVMPKCPFVNLPEARRSRWDEGLTAEGMKKCLCKRIPKSVREAIRSARKILSELRGFLEDLTVILVTIWGLLHVARVLFVLAR